MKKTSICRLFALSLAVLPASTLFTGAPLDAATIAVDGDAVIIADEGLCSLREAIRNALADAQVDNTNCEAGSGVDTIELGDTEEYVLIDADPSNPRNGLPLITSTITINGNGSTIERAGECLLDGTRDTGEFRIFEIQGANVTLRDLTLSGGCADGNGSSNDGGAIFSDGDLLRLTRVVIEDNQAFDYAGGLFSYGQVLIEDSTFRRNFGGGGAGAIGQSSGELTILRSTISENTAGGDGGGGIGTGGNTKATRTVIRNSTISGNISTGLGGGGIGNIGDMRVDTCTITGNSATGLLGGGGIGNGGILILNNSIMAGNGDGGDCTNLGLLAAAGVNMDSDGSCAAEDADIQTVALNDLALEPLADNGGPTETHDLGFGSVAIDAVLDCIETSGNDLDFDQRGFDRPQDGDGDGVARCDVGAVEASEVIVVDGSCTLGDAIEAANLDRATVGGCVDGTIGNDILLLDVDTHLAVADTVRSTLLLGAFAGTPDITSTISVRAGEGSVIERSEGLSCDVPDGPDEFRLLQIGPGTEGRLELVGVTLRGGCADKGGAVAGFNRLDIVDSTFRSNHAISADEAEGGAVSALETDVTVSGTLFQGNSARGNDAFGGALAAGSLRSLTSSQFVENTAEGDIAGYGGGLYVGSDAEILHDLVFESNIARAGGDAQGGGLLVDYAESMSRVLLSNNSAIGSSVGGALAQGSPVDGGSAAGGGAHISIAEQADGLTFVDNSAVGGNSDAGAGGNAEGGGLYLASEGTLRHLTISGNTARAGQSTSGQGGSAFGGGVQLDGEFHLEHATIALNEAVAGLGGAGNGVATGGGILASEMMTLGSSLLEQNTTDAGGTVTNSDCGELGSLVSSLGYNAVVEPTTCAFTATGDQVGVVPSILPLGDYGCVTPLPNGMCLPTHAVILGSEVIDTGSCTASGVASDSRELVRPIDDLGVANADDGCDVGAYESRDLDEGTGDGVEDGIDNCPADVNPDQTDSDSDGFGDACDLCLGDNETGDGDGDGVCADQDCDDANPSIGAECPLFADGFESGDVSAWGVTVP